MRCYWGRWCLGGPRPEACGTSTEIGTSATSTATMVRDMSDALVHAAPSWIAFG